MAFSEYMNFKIVMFYPFSGKGSKKKAKNSNKNKKPRPYVKEITNCQAFSHICSGYFKVNCIFFYLICNFVLDSNISFFLLSLSIYRLVLCRSAFKFQLIFNLHISLYVLLWFGLKFELKWVSCTVVQATSNTPKI